MHMRHYSHDNRSLDSRIGKLHPYSLNIADTQQQILEELREFFKINIGSIWPSSEQAFLRILLIMRLVGKNGGKMCYFSEGIYRKPPLKANKKVWIEKQVAEVYQKFW